MSEAERAPITVVVPTRDEQDRLGACLDSVRWVDQVVVIDSDSRDDTVAVARSHGAVVIERPFTGYGDQRNHASEHARNDWILCVDADERVTDALAAEITTLVRGQPGHAGYTIPRRTWVAGRLIRRCGWQRDRVLRLYDRRRGRWNRRPVHERVELDGGTTGQLESPLHHHTYRNLSEFANKSRRYAELGARTLHERGRRARLGHMLFLPVARFVKMYILQRGFLDGVPGLLVCGLAAHGVFLKYAHLWELERSTVDPLKMTTPRDGTGGGANAAAKGETVDGPESRTAGDPGLPAVQGERASDRR